MNDLIKKMGVGEKHMLRLVYGNTFTDRIPNADICGKVEVTYIGHKGKLTTLVLNYVPSTRSRPKKESGDLGTWDYRDIRRNRRRPRMTWWRELKRI